MGTVSQPAGSSAPATPSHSTPKQRSLLIDVVRGIAITLVVLGHTNQGILHRGWWGADPFGIRLNNAIYSFHMPAFFFVSGIFLRAGVLKRGQGRYTAEKLRTMIYPYLVWACLIYAAERFLFASFMVTHVRTTAEFLLALATADFSWFLPTIFLAVMAGMLLRNAPMPLVFAVSVVAQLFMPWLHAADLDAVFRFLPFLILGLWLGRGFERFERVPALPATLGAAALLLAIVMLTGLPSAGLRWWLTPLGIVGIAMLLLVARALGRGPAARALAWAGEGSFGIFLMSEFPQGGGRVLVQKLFHTTSPWPQLIVPTLLAVTIPCWIYQRRDQLRIGWLFVLPRGKDE